MKGHQSSFCAKRLRNLFALLITDVSNISCTARAGSRVERGTERPREGERDVTCVNELIGKTGNKLLRAVYSFLCSVVSEDMCSNKSSSCDSASSRVPRAVNSFLATDTSGGERTYALREGTYATVSTLGVDARLTGEPRADAATSLTTCLSML